METALSIQDINKGQINSKTLKTQEMKTSTSLSIRAQIYQAKVFRIPKDGT